MVLFIKLMLACFFIVLGFGGYFITQDFFSTLTTVEYKNSSLFGRFITKVIWGTVAAAIVCFEIMIIVSIFSKITIG